MSPTNGSMRDQLLNGGFIYPTMMGLQPDLNVAWLKKGVGDTATWQEGSFCDHNCVRAESENPTLNEPDGGYDCFAATDLNKGIVPTSMAGFDPLHRWMEICIDGQRLARDDFMREDFARYCDDREIPPAVAEAYREAICSNRHEINLFGGNPELNQASTKLVSHFRNRGNNDVVNFTTTGGRNMRDQQFVADLIACPPDRFAVSADDLTPEEAIRFTSMSLDELKEEHGKIHRRRGQRRKALEGIWTAKFAEQTPGFPPILFNTVIHDRNVDGANEMIDALERALPHAIINPYLAQSSMYHTAPVFKPEHLPAVRKVITRAIERTKAGARIPKRLPFYFLLESVFRTHKGKPEEICKALAGYGIWQCYRPNACWYLQIGRFEQPIFQIQGLRRGKGGAPGHDPGGHLGCTWNAWTVTQPEQIRNAEQVRRFLRGAMATLAAAASSPCLGCDMPRLLFHAICIELGMNPIFWPAMREVRSEHAGHLFN